MEKPSFWWGGGDEEEEFAQYIAGGLHPVHLGDVLPPSSDSTSPHPAQQYRILNKLGHGSFSTVWLAEILYTSSRHYVALKICAAEVDPKQQLGIFSRIPQDTQNVLRLRDSFSIEGPNGVHLVLVHDVLGNFEDVVGAVGGEKLARALCRQLACGLAVLHQREIVHGDLHARNFGIALPMLDNHSPNEIIWYFNCPEVTVVLPKVPLARPEALPRYLVPPISVIDYMEVKDPTFANIPLRAEIMDLGNATVIGEQVHPSCTPAGICAPELMFERVVRSIKLPATKASDIWSFACTIYEVAFRASLFHFATDNYMLLGAMAKVCGEVPSGWRNYWDSHEKLKEMDISQEAANCMWQGKQEHVVKILKYTPAEADEIIDLLRFMLKMDPTQRPSIEEVLQHPWFAGEYAKLASFHRPVHLLPTVPPANLQHM